MLKSHEKFHSANGKRRILVADDELINRELLRQMLQDEYEILVACDGAETLEMIREHKDTLSLVLLDILMPVMSGLEVLRAVKADAELSRVPIIVTTAEKETEIESLQLGAIDFIPKPYPVVGVVKARVLRTIELYEDRYIIQSTERDALTGLYNKEYFYRYAEQFDQYHKNISMDAVIVDINHFRMINERYGKAYGDSILKRIGQQVKMVISDSDGIVCRKEADTFMIYCPHREDYPKIMEEASVYLADSDSAGNRVRLRMGIYSNVDKSIDIERRFDRAKMAADTVKGSFTQNIGIYDNELHEKQLYEERLIEEFPAAIADGQFQVYYQPKFSIQRDTPVLNSAEALVRWNHPELGMISPGIFIPLFENNGLIRKLDHFVWRETARQIKDWKDRLRYSVPVSVNVSRIDMYDPELADNMQKILNKYGLTGKDIFLEVTESAYTQDSEQIIETVQNLRSMGFKVEMDDFGTGYSSLNMISNLPIDALKLDMQFVRDAFVEGGNSHMMEVIISIAEYLAVPIIAEGVETQEQLHALKILGCDIVQGYFFSKPVPASLFEPFILQKKEVDLAELNNVFADEDAFGAKGDNNLVEPDIMSAFQAGDQKEQKRYPGKDLKDGEADTDKEEKTDKSGIHLKNASIIFVIIAVIAAAALLISDIVAARGHVQMEVARERYIEAEIAASNLESGSDYLTDRVRSFVVTGDVEYLKDFVTEVEETRRRDKAVEDLENLLDESENSVVENLNTALTLSNELIGIEHLAMRLMIEAGDYDPADLPTDIASMELPEEYRGMTAEQMKEEAANLVYNERYTDYKDRIRENVDLCTTSLIESSGRKMEQSAQYMSSLVNIQTILTLVFLLIVLGIVVFITLLIRKPLSMMVDKMQRQETIPPTGVEELRFVTRTYNHILRENKEAQEKLTHEASHDALTGLFNRGAYDLLIENADKEHMALLLIDVDHFKQVNDTYGHAIGDRVLKRVADILRHSFRSVDILCRIGGDEFAVVMTRVNSSMRQLVLNKITQANDVLQNPKDDLPPVSLSVGVAFSDRENPQGDIFRDADTALYQVKEAGRNGCRIFGDVKE